jgi:hypothetical protein
MGSQIRPILRRPILFIACSLALSFTLTLFFGFFIGMIINMALFTAVAFYNKSRQLRTQEKFEYNNKIIGRGQRVHKKDMKLKFLCLVCGSEVFDVTCKTCGSRMKKPVF